VRRLAGGIPRALPSHRTPEGAAYGSYCRAILRRLGPLGPESMPTLKEAGRVVLELERVNRDAAAAERVRNKRRRDRELARLDRRKWSLRDQLVKLERRLAELAAANGEGEDLAARIARLQRESP